MKFHFTPSDIDRLQQLYSNHTNREIAAIIGCSIYAVKPDSLMQHFDGGAHGICLQGLIKLYLFCNGIEYRIWHVIVEKR